MAPDQEKTNVEFAYPQAGWPEAHWRYKQQIFAVRRNVTIVAGLTVQELANRMATRPSQLLVYLTRSGIYISVNTPIDVKIQREIVEAAGHQVTE